MEPEPDLALLQFLHELRNQLTVIRVCANALAILVPPGTADDAIAQLRAAAQAASQLAQEMLAHCPPPPDTP